MSRNDDDMLSTAALRNRGWTPAMIKRLLGEPNKFKTNPIYRSAAPMKLYDAKRVEGIEQSIEFAVAKDKAALRSQAGRSIAEDKRKTLLAAIEKMQITVTVLESSVLLRRAINSYNNAPRRVRDDNWASENSDQSFLERIQVNFIRHELTSYDYHLWEVAGQIGVNEARIAIAEKVFDAIADAYPQFAAECHQLDQRSLIRIISSRLGELA